MDRWTEARAGIIYGLAVQQFEAGELDKAGRTVNKALSIKPDSPKYNVLAARIALENGELERAYRHLELAMSGDRPGSEVHYYLGVVMQRWQNYERALAAYNRAFDAEPDNVAPLLAVAEMLVKLDRGDEAVGRLKAKASYFEHNADLRLALGRILLKQRRIGPALDQLREAYLLAPDDPVILEQLALAEYAGHHYAQATTHIKQLIQSGEYDRRRDLRMVLADCYQATGRPADSRAILLQLTRDDASDVNAWIKLGQAAWMVGDGARLKQAAERTMHLAPQRYEAHLLAGVVDREAGRLDAAIAHFEQAAALGPDSALPHLMEGMTWQARGQTEAAASAYRRARAADPGDNRARQLLAALDPH
ncbi:MAG: tetratricopeptide repeat protein [Alphaproteobacteria bacterium]|nr:tetratricopeptide repeat protein [Alphaproteobacteria bacterium]